VVSDSCLIFQFVHRLHDKPVVAQLIVAGLHGRHFDGARFAPRGPKIHQDDLSSILAQTVPLAVEIHELKIFSRHSDGRNPTSHRPTVERGHRRERGE